MQWLDKAGFAIFVVLPYDGKRKIPKPCVF
jgi:hypothetical protein